MQTGMVSSENIAQVLRNIAQKRQNGSLDISLSEDKSIIIFSNGKIVDAYLESENVLARAARRMDKIAEDSSPELLKTAFRHDVLNFLFDLDLARNSIYEFRNYMPEFDKELAANISVGQFLLDKASLDSEIKRFGQIFQPHSLITKVELAGLELSEEEKVFYELLPESASLENIFEVCFLSRYHIVINLLSFYERAILEVEKDTSEISSAEPVDRDIINVLEVTSERPFVEKELELNDVKKKVSAKITKTQNEEDIVEADDTKEIEENVNLIEEPTLIRVAEKPLLTKKKTTKASKKSTKLFSIDPYKITAATICILYILIAAVILSTWGSFFITFN